MKIYECPECGNVKLGKDWQICNNHNSDIGMVEVMSWGRNGISLKGSQLLESRVKV